MRAAALSQQAEMAQRFPNGVGPVNVAVDRLKDVHGPVVSVAFLVAVADDGVGDDHVEAVVGGGDANLWPAGAPRSRV